jgi:hypothetical protein
MSQKKITFLRENFNGLYRQEQEYLRRLVRSLLYLQNSGAAPAMAVENAAKEANTPALSPERKGEEP